MRLLGVLLVVAGCANPIPPPVPDGPGSDGSPNVGGLVVSWDADPSLPGMINGKILVTEATFQIDYLQVESDAGHSEKTARSRIQLHWAGAASPPQIVFPEAPAATYQSILITVRSGSAQPAYEIRGTWLDDDGGSGAGSGAKNFRITDSGPMIMLQIACQKTLPPGGTVSIPIKVDLTDAFDEVDFKKVPMMGNELVLENGPQLMAFRNQMSNVFDLNAGN